MASLAAAVPPHVLSVPDNKRHWFQSLIDRGQCGVKLRATSQLPQLAAGLRHSEIAALRTLHLVDARPRDSRAAAPGRLAALVHMPELRSLVSSLGLSWLGIAAASLTCSCPCSVRPTLGTPPAQNCGGMFPEAALHCQHLTSLHCRRVVGWQLSEGAATASTSLQRLKLSSCSLPDGAFPAALCLLGQLTRLSLVCCQLSRLPPAFSNLR